MVEYIVLKYGLNYGVGPILPANVTLLYRVGVIRPCEVIHTYHFSNERLTLYVIYYVSLSYAKNVNVHVQK